RVVLDELHRAAAGEEGVDGIGLLRGDLGEQGLELDVRERQREVLDDLAAALLEPFGEALHRLGAGRVVPGDGHRALVTALAFDGSDSSSSFTYWISRPASLPPCSCTYRRKPFSIMLPSAA